MAKITAIIDIGSNSVRMTVFKRTSRFGFYLLKEIKSKVRISEGAYCNNGNLQPVAVDRAICALREFLNVAKAYKATKILCVATSAVRDAPNRSDFILRAKREIGLNIKVIDGAKEAHYGAVAALNLLYVKDAITVDIGGGSTELALIRNGKIEELCSLNLGTVRLKELFFDNSLPMEQAKNFIRNELGKIPSCFKSATIIGIGGTNRAIADAIMEIERYNVESIHGYEIDLAIKREFFDRLIECKTHKLKNFKIKPERYDVIREGALIVTSIVDLVGASKIIASGSGVREGVFLSDLLRNQNTKFPQNFNPSVKSLLDRFCDNEEEILYIRKIAIDLFDVLSPIHTLDKEFARYVSIASKLVNIGTKLSFYNHRHHGFLFVLNSLEYGFSHYDRLLIAMIVKYHGRRFGGFDDDKFLVFCKHNEVIIKWLSIIITIAETINSDMSSPKVSFSYKEGVLYIQTYSDLYICKEKLKNILKEVALRVEFIRVD